MPTIKVRICYLCYIGKGEIKKAVGYYLAGNMEPYDVCEDCRKEVEAQEIPVIQLSEEEVIEEG